MEEAINRSVAQNQLYSSSRNFITETALQLRLDTKQILKDIDAFLKGGEYVDVTNEESGLTATVFQQTGEPKANKLGIQSISNFLKAIFNTAAVQGNFLDDRYDDYVKEVNISIAAIIITNSLKWGIEDDDIDYICDFIMLFVIPFFSRLIDNKEREGYAENLRTSETSSVTDMAAQKRKFFGL